MTLNAALCWLTDITPLALQLDITTLTVFRLCIAVEDHNPYNYRSKIATKYIIPFGTHSADNSLMSQFARMTPRPIRGRPKYTACYRAIKSFTGHM